MFSIFFSSCDYPLNLLERINTVVDNNSWVCPIKERDYDSYYTISRNEIVLASKQYKSSDEYYGALTHLMAHSVGDFSGVVMMEREHCKEELICECCSAILLCMMGMKKTVNEDSIMYKNYWKKSWEDEKFRSDIEKAVKERLWLIINNLVKLTSHETESTDV